MKYKSACSLSQPSTAPTSNLLPSAGQLEAAVMKTKVLLLLLVALAAGALALPISDADRARWEEWRVEHNKTYGAQEVLSPPL